MSECHLINYRQHYMFKLGKTTGFCLMSQPEGWCSEATGVCSPLKGERQLLSCFSQLEGLPSRERPSGSFGMGRGASWSLTGKEPPGRSLISSGAGPSGTFLAQNNVPRSSLQRVTQLQLRLPSFTYAARMNIMTHDHPSMLSW